MITSYWCQSQYSRGSSERNWTGSHAASVLFLRWPESLEDREVRRHAERRERDKQNGVCVRKETENRDSEQISSNSGCIYVLNVCFFCVRAHVCVCRSKGSDFDECVLTDGVTPLSLPPLPLQPSCHGWISRSNHLSYLFHTARTQHGAAKHPGSAAAFLLFYSFSHYCAKHCYCFVVGFFFLFLQTDSKLK